MQGWIKLYRKLLFSDVFQNEKLLKVFIYCLLKATHTELTQKVGRQTVVLKPGQFIFGRKKAAIELNMKESTVRDYINILKKDGTIFINSTNKYSVITVVNWELYQSHDDFYDSKYDSKPTAEGQQIDTNKNEKNDKNEKENITTTTDDPVVLFQQLICQLSPLQVQKLDDWVNTFNDKEIINEAIRIADDKNKRYYGFVEYLLKEWHDNRLNSVDTVRSYERNKFAKTKDEYSSRKKVIRQEPVPAWLNNYNLQKKEKEPEVDEAFKKDIEERLKKYKKEA